MPRAATQSVQTPGGEVDPPEAAASRALANAEHAEEADKDALIAKLQAQLAAKEKAEALPQVVFEPKTPNGMRALEASQFAHLTVAQLMAKIDAGEVKEPITSVLCADGYYARRS